MPFKGGYSTDKKVNKKIAIGILIALFLQSLGLFAAIGFDLATPLINSMPGVSILNIILLGGTLWISFGLHKYRIA
jgi:hypothetical protein